MPAKKILAIDDEKNICSAIERILSAGGMYQVEMVTDSKEAIDKVNFLKPDLILLDIMMPGINGIQICKMLRENPLTATVPVIMVTAMVDEEYIVSAIQSGADDYIMKPFDPQELKDKVAETLANFEKGLLPSQVKYRFKTFKENKD